MPDDHATRFTAEALAKVDAFIAQHGELTRQGVAQPSQGATNRVVFARRGDDLIVFKIFCEAERKERECFGLRHWHATGLVPELLWDIDPRIPRMAQMIAMSYVPGEGWAVARKMEGEEAWARACRETGRAVGLLTKVPLSPADQANFESRFYREQPTLEAYLGRLLALGRSINDRDPDFRDAFWTTSLDFIEAATPGILSQPRVLYHQDVSNFHVQHGRFTGFFDLEMCRVGCAAMQLGSALIMCLRADPPAWPLFREGWESGTSAEFTPRAAAAAVAVHLLLGWREISRYLSYDGTPGTGFAWAAPADPVYYRDSFTAVDRLLQTGAF